ncbi:MULTISPECIES: MauE/DoxX family redox-associated membrane protein [unclassified Brachybacterium]|uniref:MauE/DoxX family redox-associated membrane protein n=1 Tax=unclassified Brachybacterium TaxID=2623841 RepID=UPI0040331E33
MTTVLIAAPILLSLTLLISGLAKLGARQGTEDAMTSLRIPLRPFHGSIASVLPVAEIVLALILWVPAVPLQVMVSLLVAALMLTYLVIIARALTWDETVECSCFGTLASPTVSRVTLGRNVLLSALALLTILSAASGSMTAVLVQQPLSLVNLGVVLLLAVVLTVLSLGGTTPEAEEGSPAAGARGPAGERAPAAGAGASASARAGVGTPVHDESEIDDEGELLDYERDAVPAGVLQRPDGSLVTLRVLSAQQAALLVFVSEGCGPCERVLDEVPGWITTLSPFMQVKTVFSRPLEKLRERTLARVGDHALHDPVFSAREALGSRGAPSAVLLGADGMLAGGPVTGGSDVIAFVQEIQEQLQSAQADGELPIPEG